VRYARPIQFTLGDFATAEKYHVSVRYLLDASGAHYIIYKMPDFEFDISGCKTDLTNDRKWFKLFSCVDQQESERHACVCWDDIVEFPCMNNSSISIYYPVITQRIVKDMKPIVSICWNFIGLDLLQLFQTVPNKRLRRSYGYYHPFGEFHSGDSSLLIPREVILLCLDRMFPNCPELSGEFGPKIRQGHINRLNVWKKRILREVYAMCGKYAE
jgi:hypothetical protein